MVELISILLMNNPLAIVLVKFEPLACNSEIECREVKAIALCYEDMTCRYGDYVLELEEED